MKNQCKNTDPKKVINLKYLEGVFVEEDLNEFSDLLRDVEIDFIAEAVEPRYINGIEDLFPQILVILSDELVRLIVLSLAKASLDAIKSFIILIHSKSLRKPLTKMESGKADTKVMPNIHLGIGKIRAILPVNIDDEKFEYFVDKMFESVKDETITKESYFVLDNKTGEEKMYSREEIVRHFINYD